jgi:nitrite reductase/ring-hydroxylating ferredoxin subunit
MMPDTGWTDLGPVDQLKTRPIQQLICGKTPIALTYKDGRFSAISGVCNHVGGPLGEGTLEGEYLVCPWHYWKFPVRRARASRVMSRTAYRPMR